MRRLVYPAPPGSPIQEDLVVLIPENDEDEQELERLEREDEIGSASSLAEQWCEAHFPRRRAWPKIELRYAAGCRSWPRWPHPPRFSATVALDRIRSSL